MNGTHFAFWGSMKNKNLEMTESEFRTSDLALAAYLLMKTYRLQSIHRQHNGKATFQFNDRPTREKDVLAFINRQATVEPIGFLDHLKSLKAMAFEA